MLMELALEFFTEFFDKSLIKFQCVTAKGRRAKEDGKNAFDVEREASPHYVINTQHKLFHATFFPSFFSTRLPLLLLLLLSVGVLHVSKKIFLG